MTVSDLPPINASLNALSAVFLGAGLFFIRRRNVSAHRKCMISAFAVSALFLACYLTYHFSVRAVTRFSGQGWIRPVYFILLISHIILAMVILPLAIITLTRALRERFDSHRKIARWTWPIWMYVSVTGVLVYLMLYHLYPAG
jgi:putative membrane protein